MTTNPFDEALKQCGVTEATLAPSEKAALDRDGYFVLSGVIDADWLKPDFDQWVVSDTLRKHAGETPALPGTTSGTSGPPSLR